ncbi:MAG: tetratricopeptide repeat protein [Phycisphaerales bacterium]|nr:tetratricopeptide repeat protein [Phycisphaerales bacterium]
MSDRLSQLRTLASADPTDADVPYMIAQELLKAGDVDGAVASFDTCLALDANYHYARYHKAKALESDGRTAEAIAILREALPIAQAQNESKAVSELTALLDELT